jgi:hypothetical protein
MNALIVLPVEEPESEAAPRVTIVIPVEVIPRPATAVACRRAAGCLDPAGCKRAGVCQA